MEELAVYVPQAGSRLEDEIAAASGIVGSKDEGGNITIDYEGNIYGAENIITFADRVNHAAGRHRERYPTRARRYGMDPGELLIVGYFDGERVRVDNSEALTSWLGTHDYDAELHITSGAYGLREEGRRI